jgi:hypothetical protein
MELFSRSEAPFFQVSVVHLHKHKTLSGIVYTQNMLSYDTLKDKPREFLAATGLRLAEFERLLPAFQAAYEHQYPPELTYEGKARQRGAGGGAKGTLPSFADKLLFILVYHKTNPLQVMHGLQFALSQSQANYWIHRLLPVVQHGTGPGARCPTC